MDTSHDTTVSTGKLHLNALSSEGSPAPDAVDLATTGLYPVGAPGVKFSAKVTLPGGKEEILTGWGDTTEAALSKLLEPLVARPFRIIDLQQEETDSGYRSKVFVKAEDGAGEIAFGSAREDDSTASMIGATLRALSNGDILKRKYQTAGFREADAATERILDRVTHVLGSDTISDRKRAELQHQVLGEVNAFAAAVTTVAINTPDEARLLSRFETRQGLVGPDGSKITENITDIKWENWFPGLDNDNRTLGEVVGAMPAVPDNFIPRIVRMFENPKGLLKFRGAISLEDHNNLHVILGRGLQDQDEAFVLGFTMGSTKNLTRIEQGLFKFVLAHVYSEPYRIPPKLHAAYDLGVQAGKEMGIKNIHKVDTQQLLGKTLGEVRAMLGIDSERLRGYFQREAAMIPYTMASIRLPI